MSTLISFKECKSTNDEILSFLNRESKGFLAVYTLNQTDGKGQYGNKWVSIPEMNVALTIALRAEIASGSLFNFHTAVLLADFLAKLTKYPVQIKWPNDIIVKNKKVAGILTEKKSIDGVAFLIVGIGLNVLQEDFAQLPKGGSILTQTGLRFDPDGAARNLYEYLKENFRKLDSDEMLLKNLNEILFRRDLISVFELNGSRQNGIIKNVDADGFLWIELENDGLRKFRNQEIQLLY